MRKSTAFSRGWLIEMALWMALWLFNEDIWPKGSELLVSPHQAGLCDVVVYYGLLCHKALR